MIAFPIPQVPLQVDQAYQGLVVQESRFHHHAFRVDGPPFDEDAGSQDRAELAGVAVGMGQLDEMARHGLVHREVVNGAYVVLAQERLSLFLRPVLGQRRDGVESLLSHVQGARRIAVGQETPRWNSGMMMISTGSGGRVSRSLRAQILCRVPGISWQCPPARRLAASRGKPSPVPSE